MTGAQIEIQLVAIVVAAACALPGVFLVLRRVALLSDAISHAILLGIVVAFFIVEDLASPFLIFAAAATGVLTVFLVELLIRTGLVKQDASIGLVFPVLFSIGVILISRYAGNVHIDTDAVLLGELAFAPFNRFYIAGVDVGPKALWLMGGILALNIVLITVFFKEYKLVSFDAGLAAALGFSPALVTYLLMAQVSVTAVGAFDAVGSILVVALMIAPPATAYLLTDSLPRLVLYSVVIGVVGAVSGYWIAHWLDVSIAGSMASMSGFLFGAVFVLVPERGLLAQALRRRRQKREFTTVMLLIHLYTHEDLLEAESECRVDHLTEHLSWPERVAKQVVEAALDSKYVMSDRQLLRLTDRGRAVAREAIVNWTPGSQVAR
jgi:manganese/zinc/iron transport system permease protein